MSRLDDELKLMFQREEPSADFSERVLARIQAKAQPKPSLWQRLIAFLQPNAMPWAVAAAILLVAIIGFTQYQRLHSSAPENQFAGNRQPDPVDNKTATAPAVSPEKLNTDEVNPQDDKRAGDPQPKRAVTVRHKKLPQQNSHRLNYAKAPAANDLLVPQPKSAGEQAKEQLLKALNIASATVNEAKKLAIGSD
jgi:hypothetical protein